MTYNVCNVQELAEQDTRLHRASTREMAGPCPNPDCRCSNDGFHVDPTRNPVLKRDEQGQWIEDVTKPPLGGFRCRGCWQSEDLLDGGIRRRGWGTPIEYLMHMRKLSYDEAHALLQEHADDTPVRPVKRAKREQKRGYITEHWQKTTTAALKEHEARLWDPTDTTALDYLHERGFSDETIRKAHLGYSVQDDIPRLIIPSVNRETVPHDAVRYVAIYRRDLRPNVLHEQRWKDAPGGTKSELYLADCLRLQRPTIITEAPLDALSAVQACGDRVGVVATGGTNGARLIRWIGRLALLPHVFVAFDADLAGEEAATWWLERLPNATRLFPTSHDLNAMLMEGCDLRKWILEHVEACCVCGCRLFEREAGQYTFQCDKKGSRYCAEHRPAPPVEEAMEEKEKRLDAFVKAVFQIAQSLPTPCQVHVVPPGYTIEERAQELNAELQAEEVDQWQQARVRNAKRERAQSYRWRR